MKRWAGIARLGGIGDNLVASSVLRPLKHMGYMTEVITSEFAQVVFHHNPLLDKLSVKKDTDIPSGEDWQKWFVGRAKEYDIFAHLSHSMEGLLALHVNATAFHWRPEYRRKICGANYLETVHDIVGVPHEFGPLFFPSEDERVRAIATKQKYTDGKPYISWVISGSRVDKGYPFASMLICRIIKELDIPVMMFGIGDKQSALAKQVQDDVMRTNSSLKGLHVGITPNTADPGGEMSWSIRRSITQALHGDMLISPDTGIAWAAAFETIPKIIMLSHASQENITKHWVNTTTLHADQNKVPCWPCHRLHNDMSTCTPAKDGIPGAACMADIPVETVIEAIKKIWHKNNVIRLHDAKAA